MVTSKKFDRMVAITAGLKVNWAHILFQVLVGMVNNPNHQSQGFAVKLSVLLENLVKTDFREVVKLHPQKVSTNKSVHTYIKKNLGVGSAGETSKVSGATASEQQSTAGEMEKPTKAAAEKEKKKKKQKDKKNQACTRTAGDQMKSNAGSIPEIPTGGDKESTIGGPEANMETVLVVERQADGDSTTGNPEANMEMETTPVVERQGEHTSTTAEQEEPVEKQADDPSTIDGLETSLVCHYADSQQKLVDELAMVKSHLADMDCIKELHDAKMGEGPSIKRGKGQATVKRENGFDQERA
ncbi:hypothetical protein F511_36839 [Dorcoceras hygrometricum]|uniref:Uncharacterized protein n=1 Tax=Dorcoceras hygrometricum TaxID=472368 RepID=A0A2Z7B3X4_9LAMI|nr:hypothetical protein F511_36839 [Dorcoceras hygrometricum]